MCIVCFSSHKKGLFTSLPKLMLVEDTSADEPGTSTVRCSEVKSLSLAWAPDCTVLDVFNSHFDSACNWAAEHCKSGLFNLPRAPLYKE